MSNYKNLMICETIKSMEQGEFQSFCLDFIPIYDSKYKGLKRFGNTAEGKTRKGTPDMILTLGDGKIIAGECSTKKDYWKQKKDFNKWKPCEDINKCINEFKNDLKEVILCSNQEQPTNKPKIDSEIIKFAKDKTLAIISIYDLAKIESIISRNIQNPSFRSIIKKYFNELYNIELYKLSSTQKSVEEGFKKIINELIKDKSFSLTKGISIEETKYQRDSLPFPGEIKRILPDDFPFLKPINSIYTLLGIPKIGKTSLMAELAKNFQKQQVVVKWYDCPPNKEEISEMINAFCMNIFKKYFVPDKYLELKENKISIYSLEKKSIQKQFQKPTVYIIDNAEFLLNKDKSIKSICEILKKIKYLDILSDLGFIFISSRSLKNDCPLISKEVNAPFWTKDEISGLLSLKITDSGYYKYDSYIEILMAKSYGHPLIALALAKKYRTLEGLVSSMIKIDQDVNEELEAEVKKLLFEDILESNDFKNFVLRLSPLIYPSNEEVFKEISNKIEPVISYPFNLIVEKLDGTVLEGNKKSGYRIADIYRNVAQNFLSTGQKNKIFDVVSDKLLIPNGKILDADRTISGIIYAFLAGKIESAFYWTLVILQSINNQKLSKIQRKHIITRLEPISFWNPSKELKLLIQYYTVIVSMAIAYANIENNKKSIELLKKIKMPSENIADKKLKESFLLTVEAAKYYKMLLYAKSNDIKNLLETLNNIDFDFIKNILSEKDSNLILFFKESIPVISIKQIPASLIKKIINSADLRSEQDIVNLIFIASHLGIGIDRENINIEDFIKLLPPDNPISEVLENMIKAIYAFQKQNAEESLKQLNISISLCKEKKLWNKSVKSVISQMQGDAFYKLRDNRNAKKAYLKYLRYFYKYCKKDFIYGYVNYRLGLLSNNSKKAVNYFKKSSIIFNRYRYEDLYARSEGERGVAFVQLDQPYKFVRIAEWMIKRYFLRNRLRVAPAVSVALAQLIRIKANLKRKPLIENKDRIYPKFERKVYDRVLEKAKPQATGIVAFSSLATTYSLLGHIDRKIRSLKIALNFKPITLTDFNLKVIIISKLLLDLIPSGNISAIKKLIIEIILLDSTKVTGGIKCLAQCVFLPFNNKLSLIKKPRKEELIKLFTEIESYIKELQNENLNWWLAEIYLVKAKLSVDIFKKNQQYYYWEKTYKYGIKSDNQNVIIESAHSLSFVYADFCESIINLAEKQFSIIKVISSQNCNFERLESIGINLFNGWNNLDWRRESTYDLKAKYALMDGAKELKKANYNAQEASPIMILLLCSIFDFDDKVTNWARNLIQKEKIDNIPDFVKDKIRDYLQII